MVEAVKRIGAKHSDRRVQDMPSEPAFILGEHDWDSILHVGYSFLWRVLSRQVPPRTPCTCHVEDYIDNQTHIAGARAVACFDRRSKSFTCIPLSVR